LEPEVYVIPEDALSAADFNRTTYTSSAEQYSGKRSNIRNKILMYGVSVGIIGIAGYAVYSLAR